MAYHELSKRLGGPIPKYQTEDEIWAKFVEYMQWVEENPLTQVDYKGKDAERVVMKYMRPYTKVGFAIFAGFCEWKSVAEMALRDPSLAQIITRIESIIFAQKFDGAASNLFNSNIIARDLGLVDKKEQEVNVKSMPDWMKDDEPESKVSKG